MSDLQLDKRESDLSPLVEVPGTTQESSAPVVSGWLGPGVPVLWQVITLATVWGDLGDAAPSFDIRGQAGST